MADTSRGQMLLERVMAHADGAQVVTLARAVCLAVLVEPGLLRRARIALVPGASAGTESDLWFSPLVLTRNITGIVLDPDVVALLRQQLGADPGFADRAWTLVERLHRDYPPAVKLEEEVVWKAVQGGNTAGSEIEAGLRTAVKAMVTDPGGGRDVARWAAQAWRRLPEAVTQTDAAQLLAVGFALRLGTAAGVTSLGQHSMPASLGWLTPSGSAESVQLGVELAADGLRFVEPSPGGLVFELPRTSPLVVEIGWRDGAARHSAMAAVAPGTDVVLGSIVGPLTLRTLAGQRYVIEPELAEVPSSSGETSWRQRQARAQERGQVAAEQERLHPVPPPFEDVLASWLVKQRWFASKGLTAHDLAVVADTEIIPGKPGLRHLIVTVSHGATSDSYQIFIGSRARLPARLRHARIGSLAGMQVYDGLYDSDLTRTLLDAIVTERTVGALRFCRIPGADLSWAAPEPSGAPGDAALDSLVLTGEQANTSLVFGEAAIFKVFRRVDPGPNPDLEVAAALAELGSTHIAEPYGWVETRIDGATTVLAILSRYLRAASDGWSLAAISVRDLYATPGARAAEAGGDFAGEAERLGAATAQVHQDLADAFGTSQLAPEAVRELAEQMYRRLDLALAAVPELARYADKLGDAYSSLAKLTGPVPAQRVHGDYHLGQVMRTQTGWVVLDFEGEPASPLAQRRARSSPLRDVAGMLRSFDYAARHQLLTHPDADRLAPQATDWVRRNSDAFCAGYAAAGGLDPAENSVLLRALLLDKAVYEAIYEARNRPTWLVIPLDSIADFRGPRGDRTLGMRAPRDERTRDLILDIARTHPNWGRLRIYEELRDSGHHLDEPEVNYVLNQHKLPNLHL